MAKIGIIMGSNSDWPVMQQAAQFLKEFGVEYEARVVSAHRTPDLMFEYAETARERGIKAIIAGAGGAAHLPGAGAAHTALPAPNAALFAISLLANENPELAQKLADFRAKQGQTVLDMELPEA